MTASALPRHLLHRPERDTGPAFAIALGMHLLLFAAFAFVFHWKTEAAGPVEAELWSPSPPVVVETPPPVPVVQPPPPAPAIEAPLKVEIAEEKKPPPKKVEAPKVVAPIPPAPVKKIEPPKLDPKQAVAEAKAAQKRHADETQRMIASAGGAPTGASSASGTSDSYKGQIVSCIRPFIGFPVPDNVAKDQYKAEFEVQLLPTGEQAGVPKLVKASGLPAYDAAVERAIRRCDPFPRPREGAMPRSLHLTFDPVETR